MLLLLKDNLLLKQIIIIKKMLKNLMNCNYNVISNNNYYCSLIKNLIIWQRQQENEYIPSS